MLTLKESPMLRGKVATFYWLNGELYHKSEFAYVVEAYGDFKTMDVSHWDYWEKELSKLPGMKGKDYGYYPRGRVVYNIPNDVYIIYIDHCLDRPTILETIVGQIGIPANREVEFDEHYKCHNCGE